MDYKEKKEKKQETFQEYKNYGIVAALTLLGVAVFPLISANIGIDNKFPTSTLGWIVWTTVRLAFIVLNICIFKAFVDQAKVNIKNEPRYLNALDKYRGIQNKEFVPRSPGSYFSGLYSKKIVTLVLSSITALVGISQAIINYNWMDLISYAISLTLAIVFGLNTMQNTQEYWVEEFPEYVNKLIEKEVDSGDNRE